MATKETKNVKVLTEFMLKGKSQHVGTVISKENFPSKSDWSNLANMKPPRVEETDDAVVDTTPKKGAVVDVTPDKDVSDEKKTSAKKTPAKKPAANTTLPG
jgi:hypothetical protein